MSLKLNSDRKATLVYTLINILYYGTYAFIFLFLSIYMLDNGFTNSEIGMLMATGFIVSVFLQQLIAAAADKAQKITVSEILAAGFGLILLINVALLFMHGRSMLLCTLYCTQIILIMSVQPCLNALNFQIQSYRYKMNYGVARSMGSLAYAVVSAVVGRLLGIFGNDVLQIGVLILGSALILVLLALDRKLKQKSHLLTADSKTVKVKSEITYLQFIRKYSPFMLFIVGSILLYYSYATLNNYLYQVMEPMGYSRADYGTVQGFKAAVELFPMILSLGLVMKFGINKLVIFSSACFVIKSALTLFAGSLLQIYVATSFQMTSYGIFAPVAVYYVAELFDRQDGVKGQSLITMAYAIGCVISSLAGGIVLNSYGPKVLLTISTTASVIGMIVTILSLKVIDKKIEKKNKIF